MSTEAAQVTAVSDGEGGQVKSEVKVPDGRGEKRDGGGKEGERLQHALCYIVWGSQPRLHNFEDTC